MKAERLNELALVATVGEVSKHFLKHRTLTRKQFIEMHKKAMAKAIMDLKNLNIEMRKAMDIKTTEAMK